MTTQQQQLLKSTQLLKTKEKLGYKKNENIFLNRLNNLPSLEEKVSFFSFEKEREEKERKLHEKVV